MSALDDLVDKFVSTFSILDDLLQTDVPVQLQCGRELLPGFHRWCPKRQETSPEALSQLYERIKGPMPPLFEALLMTHRWLEVDLGLFRLLPNPRLESLAGFTDAVVQDKALSNYLLPRNLLQFGKAPGFNYDPVCFDLNRMLPNGDCPIIQLDHEDIFNQVSFSGASPVGCFELKEAFESLVNDVIASAENYGRKNR